MVEITRQNFMTMYPKIEYAIHSADFISIDTEFTGLYFNDDCKPSLFDSGSERYFKLKKSIEKFTLSQIGLTTFCGNVKNNRYRAETFSFYLCPLSFGSFDQRFCLQASSLEFLCKHKFDFNKWFYEGLPYLNRTQEKDMESELESGLLFAGIERVVDEKEIQSLCSQVAAWLPSSNVGDCLTIPLADGSSALSYIYHCDLRRRFSQVWTSTNAFGQMVIERVDPVKREAMEKQSWDSDKQQEKQQLLEMLGFTRVFRLLVQAKKPIIGHNMLMDLLFMYEKFHNPLPDSFQIFKERIHSMFPIVFDTKHINHCLRKPLESLELHRAGNLEDLYNLLNSEHIMTLTLMQPSIQLSHSQVKSETEHAHQAGYDSYLCGCVFLRVAHLLHFRNISSMDVEVCPFKDYLGTMRPYRNRVNLIRAMVNHINLDGHEPPSQRPPLIHVQTIKPGAKLVSHQLAVWFSMYGAVDIQMINTREAVVATSNFMSAREIIYAFKDHNAIKVTKYRFWEHSKLGQGIIIGSLVVATGTCVMLLINVLR